MRYLFDINETLLDLSPLDDLLGGHEKRVAWFDLMIRTALVRTAAGVYRPFGVLGVEAAAAVGSPIEPERMRAAMAGLPAHPDVADGLAAVADAGHTVVALGNSAADLIEDQLTNAGIRDLFQEVHSADTVGALKPAPAAYLAALGGQPPGEAVLVAAHDWDIAGAACAGLGTAYVDRGLRPGLPGLGADRTVARIGDLVG